MPSTEMDAWVERVLGVKIGGPAPEIRQGTVAARKLLLRWRQAQQALAQNLDAFTASVLGVPEIKADPRFAEVEAALKDVPKLVPEFGGKLEDLLDEGINAGPQAPPTLVADTLKAIADYRAKLASVPELGALERFGAKNVGVNVQLASALDGAMQEMEAELRRAA